MYELGVDTGPVYAVEHLQVLDTWRGSGVLLGRAD